MLDLHLARSYFHNVLPDERLGQQHFSLDEFRRHVANPVVAMPDVNPTSTSDIGTMHGRKVYTLIVVTEYGTKRILLGKKHRGFGKGMYNSFGGKVEPYECQFIPRSAIRELHEETGIVVESEANMAQCRVGTLHFTFADSTVEMIVHLFRIQIRFDDESRYDSGETLEMNGDHSMVIHVPSSSNIRGCDEITPIWVDDYSNLPLGNMFADDSIWLTHLLVCPPKREAQLKAWFHFQEGGQGTNTILHYCVENIEASTQTSLN
jgi:8-oxo-dGTP pyrophosphatase MutT (NUDIX family)